MNTNVEAPIGFETRFRTASASMRDAVARFRGDLLVAEHRLRPRRRQRKSCDAKRFDNTAEALLCNLAAVQMIEPGASLAIRRGSAASAFSPIYGYHFRTICTVGAGVGFWQQSIGQRDGEMSWIRTQEALHTYLPPRLQWNDLRLEDESIRLMRVKTTRGKAAPLSFD